jgi:hypothetical protein
MRCRIQIARLPITVTCCCTILQVDPEDFRWLQPKPKDSKDSGDGKVGASASRTHDGIPCRK